MALHHKPMYKAIHQVTNNQLQDQNMADHEQFPVMHIMDCHKMFVENVYHQIHLKDQNRQSIDDAIIRKEEEIINKIYHQHLALSSLLLHCLFHPTEYSPISDHDDKFYSKKMSEFLNESLSVKKWQLDIQHTL